MGVTTRTRILLVEDDLSLGELYLLAFEKHKQCEVTWVVRGRFVPDTTSGAADLILMLMNDRGGEQVFVPGDFDFAICDYQLKMSELTGEQVVAAISRQGLRVMGASGERWLNETLVKAGAVKSMVKQYLLSCLIKDREFGDKLIAMMSV